VSRPVRAIQQCDRAGLARGGEAVDLQGFGDDFTNGKAGVERGIGVLKDDLHVSAAAAQRGLG
jgi:hypothetical protein